MLAKPYRNGLNKMALKRRFFGSTAILGMLAVPGFASAAQPEPWQMNFQEAATPLMEQIVRFHDVYLLPTIIIISLFVLALLAIVVVKFNEKSNPNPSRTTHNTTIEVLWTVIPVAILVVIAVPSFKLLYKSDVIPKVDMTIKATGHQWYWNYEYVDHGKFSFDAYMIADEDLKEGQPRLLETDNRVVIPSNTIVRVQVTAADVLHAWTIPAFGRKIDAVPGRLNEIWIGPVKNEGVYYGQCSELCGVNHGFMPITVEVVSKDKFNAWVEKARREFAADEPSMARQFAKNETR